MKEPLLPAPSISVVIPAQHAGGTIGTDRVGRMRTILARWLHPPRRGFPRAGGRLRVLVVCAVNGHGGPVESIRTVLRRVAPGRAVVHVATQPLDRDDDLTPLADEVLAIPRPRGADLIRAQWRLVRRAGWARRSVDVIHANGLTEAVVVLPLALATRIPVVVWSHSHTRPRPFSIVGPLVRRLPRWTFLAVSSTAADRLGVPGAQRVLNPIDRSRVVADRVEADRLRVSFLAGTDRPYKGFDLLPAIIDRVTADGVHWQLYTSPPHSSQDPRSLAAWDRLLAMPAEEVSVHGRVSEVGQVYAVTDVVIAPSRLESFNRVVAEALVNGIPVVASDLLPHRELLEHGGGLLFESEDPVAAAALIDRLASDPLHRRQLADQARLVAHRFDADTVVEELLEVWTTAGATAAARSMSPEDEGTTCLTR